MAQIQPRVLIDLTDIEKWPGLHGGIQRVVYGISKAMFDQRDRGMTLDFISFDETEKRFYHSSFQTVRDRVEQRLVLSADDPAPADPVAAVSFRSRLKQLVPARIRSSTRVRNTARQLGLVAPPTPVSDKPWVSFNKNDVVLVLGMPWENLDIQRTLTHEREQTGFVLIQLIYDLVICLYPHLHHPANIAPYTENMLATLDNSDGLLAISQSSANDLRTYANTQHRQAPDTRVIRLGDDLVQQKLARSDTAKPDARIARNFIACVGTVEIRKNHTLLYYAYKLAQSRGEELPQLVIVGGSGWFTGDVQYLINTDPAIKEKIIILHGVNDQGLDWIYRNCLFTVYPSMYEGWGLPVAESLAYNKLCVSSDTSSMPEIAGDLIDYFSPFSPEECLAKIQRYMDKKTRLKKEKELTQHYHPTSWSQTADQVRAYIKNVGSHDK